MGAIIRSILASLLFTAIANAQMPPHPRLLDNPLKSHQIQTFLESKKDYEKRGIDAAWSSGSRPFGANSTPTDDYKVLVLLVNFPDKNELVSSDFFDALLFNRSAGTLWDFYNKTSYGVLDLITNNSCASISWITVNQNYDYYVNSNHGLSGEYPKNAQRIVEEAVLLADQYIDFSDYDNDGDGFVDALFVVHAGTGAEYSGSSSDIWSHAWSTFDPIRVDGVNVYRYAMTPEYWVNPGDMTIGVYAHELGHAAFGLPDLYDRDNTSYGLGYWSLMSYGSWNGNNGSFPAFPDAWSRLMMGYGTSTTLNAQINNKEILNSANNSNQFFRINSLSNSKEYFLIENKQPYSFDRYLPSSGLMIYHVDENVQTQNDKEWFPSKDSTKHYLVALEQADGLWELEKKINKGNAGDPFPGSSNNTNFTNSSKPNSHTYLHENYPIEISNIVLENFVVSADFDMPQALSVSATIKQGWNIISIPVITSKKSFSEILNDNTAKLWKFDDGYSAANEPYSGLGYWYKSPEEKIVSYSGFKEEDKINVKQGWNLIGPLENTISVVNINSNPPDILFSKIYSYDGLYSIVNDLEPGKGYWAKFSQNGEIDFNNSGASSLHKKNEDNSFAYSLVISNNSDISSAIYLSNKDDLNRFELPPHAPEPKLDARFDNNGLVEKANGEFHLLKIISEDYPLKLKILTGAFELVINNILYHLNQNDEITLNEKIENLLLRNVEISNDFKIFQNYPNPFNGTTKISFSLPNEGAAKIEIFNLIGERVFYLHKNDFNAGINGIEWNASNNPSGIYLYKISSGKFSKTSKMVYLK